MHMILIFKFEQNQFSIVKDLFVECSLMFYKFRYKSNVKLIREMVNNYNNTSYNNNNKNNKNTFYKHYDQTWVLFYFEFNSILLETKHCFAIINNI